MLVFLFFGTPFGVGEFQTSVFHSVFSFDGFLPFIFEHSGSDTVSIGHVELDGVSFLPSRAVVASGSGEDVEHVIDAIVDGLFASVVCVVMSFTMHLHLAFAVGIGVPHFVHGVPVAFTGAFSEIER